MFMIENDPQEYRGQKRLEQSEEGRQTHPSTAPKSSEQI